MKISVRLIEHNDEVIANCPELDINCYGSDKHEAVRRIKRVINFYMEAAKELGLDIQKLEEINIDGEKDLLPAGDEIVLPTTSIN